MNWNEYVYLDESSPTYLRRAKDSYCGRAFAVKSASKGDVAGYLDTNGYVVLSVKNTKYYAHRVIWEMLNGKIPEGMDIDHMDRKRANNNPTNLRLVSRKVNCQNSSIRLDNTSGITGVYLTKNKNVSYWSANCCTDGVIVKKHFSINKLGHKEALRLAIECRLDMINKLNELGSEYTTTHGEHA